jgi:hypothetical protein
MVGAARPMTREPRPPGRQTVRMIRAMLFDIGGVLEITPDLGVTPQWEDRLGLPAGALGERLADIWSGGAVGTVTEADVDRALAGRLGLSGQQIAALMADIWRQYLGTANTELIDYDRGLRPRYRTGIISNSFVGAREREQAMFGVADLTDALIYSHEAGRAAGRALPGQHPGHRGRRGAARGRVTSSFRRARSQLVCTSSRPRHATFAAWQVTWADGDPGVRPVRHGF